MRLTVITLLLSVYSICISQTITGGEKMSSKSKDYLQEIVSNAGLTSASISRGSVTPAQQAATMYQFYLKDSYHSCKKTTFNERKQCALRTYGTIGQAAINSISDLTDEAQAVSEMTQTIIREIDAAGAHRNQMAHVPIPGREAVDVRPSSIEDHEKFKQAVLEHPKVIHSRFFWPGKPGGPSESAYHIEFIID